MSHIASAWILQFIDSGPILDRRAGIPAVFGPPLRFQSPRAEHVEVGVFILYQHIASEYEAPVVCIVDLHTGLAEDDFILGGEVAYAVLLQPPVDLGEIAAGAPVGEALDHHAVALVIGDVGNGGDITAGVGDEVVVCRHRVIRPCDRVEESLGFRRPVGEHIVGIVAPLPPFGRVGVPRLRC